LENRELVWLGNQVSCGVGMQSDRYFILSQRGRAVFHCPVELKSTFASEDNIRQLRRYMDWMNQYFVPNLPGDLCPILISRKMPDKQIGRKKEFKSNAKGKSEYFTKLIEKINEFNRDYKCSVKFIEYFIDAKDNIVFEEIQCL